MKQLNEGQIRTKMKALLVAARRAGFIMMLDVGKPAPHRQALSLSSLYLKPLDNSDMLVCSCCGQLYEDRMTSRLIRLPLNWCPACRSDHREGHQVLDILERNKKRRKGCRATILDSERRIREAIRRWGPNYQRELAEKENGSA